MPALPDRLQLVPGLEKVPDPSDVKLTVPVGVLAVPVAVSVTVAVQIVVVPTARVAGEQLTTVEVERDPLNVTVSVALEPKTALHGFVVPEHVDGPLRSFWLLQPAKVDPGLAVARNVTVAPLSDVVMFGLHVLVTVCEAAAAPVPPQDTGALTVPVLGVIFTDPAPVPANVTVQFRAAAT